MRTARLECFDRLLILNQKHLERTLEVLVDHYNAHRPHRRLGLTPPNGRPTIESWTNTQRMAVSRRDRLGGLLHEYERAA